MSLSPSRPPARACPFTPHRFRSGRVRSDSSLPPRPARGGGLVNKTMQLVRSLAGTRLRFASLRSVWSLLAHYAPLDREPAALLRSQARSSAPCPLSRYFSTFPPIQTKSISPPPAPRSRLPVHAPSLSLGTCPVRQLAAPPPRPRGGPGKQNHAAREIARRHQAPLRFSALRLEPARSLRSAR